MYFILVMQDHVVLRCILIRKKMHSFIAKIKFIFKKSNNLDAYNLIAKLNPILRGWSNYYNMAN